jgi:hypothetical protein
MLLRSPYTYAAEVAKAADHPISYVPRTAAVLSRSRLGGSALPSNADPARLAARSERGIPEVGQRLWNLILCLSSLYEVRLYLIDPQRPKRTS